MSDQGLSIFDEEPDESPTSGGEKKSSSPDTESTQVIPAVDKQPAAPSSTPGRPSQSRPVLPPPGQGQRPAGGSPAARPGAPAPAGTDSFPVVRRNGYDRATVDARIHQLSSEKAGLSASLT
ncbi:MAG: hypothetical protein KKA97_09340, partial [Actinobacteria bacterium]|nr:hypothetical protein [Actinomycetota bacterium]